IGEVCRFELWRFELFALRLAEGGVGPAQQLESFFDEPGRMAKLEGRREVRRQAAQEHLKKRPVELYIGRQLEEYRAELVGFPEGPERVQEIGGDLLGIAQALDVGDALVGFDGEPEASRALRHPLGQELFGRKGAEGVVHLDSIETRAVMAQELRRG